MNHCPAPYPFLDLKVLLFSLKGVRFGVDVEQIEAMTPYGGEDTADLFWFHETLGFDGSTCFSAASTVLTIRSRDARKSRVIIDAIEDLVEIGLEQIRPFPRMMASAARQKGMWGIALRGGDTILLVDFLSLLGQESAFSKTPE